MILPQYLGRYDNPTYAYSVLPACSSSRALSSIVLRSRVRNDLGGSCTIIKPNLYPQLLHVLIVWGRPDLQKVRFVSHLTDLPTSLTLVNLDLVYCYYAESAHVYSEAVSAVTNFPADTVERGILDLAAKRGLSLYTKDHAEGTLKVTSFEMDKNEGIDGPAAHNSKKQKGDFIGK